MKLKIVLWFIVMGCLFCTERSYSQYDLKLFFQVDTPAVYISIDNLDNIYVVTSKNQLLKYNSYGKLLWNYSNKAFGNLGYVDATDPMRLLLFYPAIQQVVVLNNNLNEISRFNFGSDASRLVTLIATANSNGYWIYDQLNRQLQKLSNQFNAELLSANLNQQTSMVLQPSMLKANDQALYLYDVKQGILQFDRFGTYARTLKVDSLSSLQLKNNSLLFLRNQSWTALNDSLMLSQYKFDEKVIQVSEGNKLLAVLLENKVKVFTLKKRNELH